MDYRCQLHHGRDYAVLYFLLVVTLNCKAHENRNKALLTMP